MRLILKPLDSVATAADGILKKDAKNKLPQWGFKPFILDSRLGQFGCLGYLNHQPKLSRKIQDKIVTLFYVTYINKNVCID